MSDVASGGAPGRGRFAIGVRGAIRACLIAQAVVAVVLVAKVAEENTRTGWAPEVTTRPTQPAAPGDQVRPYRPTTLPRSPGGAPSDPGIDWPDRMPKQLQVETATIEDWGEVLMLTGPLDPGAAARFEDHLAGLDTVPSHVALYSPGGVVSEALAIGRAVRDRGLDTLMPAGAACLSACPYILAAGTERRVSPDAWVGLHQSYYDQSTILPTFVAVDNIQRGEAEAMRYLDEMGVDPTVKIPALETPPDEIYILTPEELTEYRMATELIE